MKKLNLIIITTLATLFTIGCINPNKNGSKNEKDQEEVAVVKDHEENDMVQPIEFNNNEKWLVNNEMKPFVIKGEALVDDYLASSKTDYNALVVQIKEQNKQLIKSCTMKGKSHEELHKWLEPHLKLVSNLEKTTDVNEAKGLINELKSSYELYDEYFQ